MVALAKLFLCLERFEEDEEDRFFHGFLVNTFYGKERLARAFLLFNGRQNEETRLDEKT